MDICSSAFVCRAWWWDIFNYRLCCVQSQFSETDLEAKHKWIYAVVPLSVGPVGPGGGIYSSTEDVLCRVHFRKMIWRPNNRGYIQFCFWVWALSGPEVGGYIQLLRTLCAKHMS